MRQIAQSLMPPTSKRRAPRYRGKSIFVREPLRLSTPMDREARHKMLFLAEALERRTKMKGRKNGALGQIGMQVLRALLGFANKATGLCYPSYFALQLATGLSRGGIRAALRRLEAAGIICVTRRLKRVLVVRMSPLTGQPEEIITTVQDSNLYAFTLPACQAGRGHGCLRENLRARSRRPLRAPAFPYRGAYEANGNRVFD
jgi:hypothetical protein